MAAQKGLPDNTWARNTTTMTMPPVPNQIIGKMKEECLTASGPDQQAPGRIVSHALLTHLTV